MALSYSTTLRNAMLDEITTAIGNGGKLKIYSGSVPANVGAALGGATLLATLTGASPFAAGAANGVLTVGAITSDTNAAATGTPSFFRLTTSADAAVIQGTCGASDSDLNLSGLTGGEILTGGTVAVSSMTITENNP